MRISVLIVIALVVLSCDGGLAPPPPIEPGFGGTITFVRSTWPPQDSVVNLWIFASQIYPLDSTKVFAGIFPNPPNPPTIFLYPSLAQNLPFRVDSVSYKFLLPSTTYKYIGVLQHFRNDLSIRSFRVVGMYGTNTSPPQPIAVQVREFEFVQGININVNFYQPPPQPF